jgi:hypothetical protein
MRIHFVFISEGPSDQALVSHLENLCIYAGANEATGITPDFGRLPAPVGRTVTAKLQAAMRLEPEANLFFIHRDADSPEYEPRYAEIMDAATSCCLAKPWVGVVPVQETEAWLLLDEQAIRRVVGKPRGTVNLALPAAKRVEDVARPKEVLQQALIYAAQVKGRRLDSLRQDFSDHRRMLLLNLRIDGPQSQLPSWQRMREDITMALKLLDS